MSRLYNILDALVSQAHGEGTGKASQVTTVASETSYAYGDSITLEPNCFYLIQISAAFNAASVTGATRHKAALVIDGSVASEYSLVCPTNTSQTFNWMVGFNTGASPVSIKAAAASNKVLTCNLGLGAYKFG